jgi:hypothetical protein
MDIILLRPPAAPFLYQTIQFISQLDYRKLIVLSTPFHSLVSLHEADIVFDCIDYDSPMDWVAALHRAMARVVSDDVLILDPQLQLHLLDTESLSGYASDTCWVTVKNDDDDMVYDSVSMRDLKTRYTGFLVAMPKPKTLPNARCLLLSKEAWVKTGGMDPVFADVTIATVEWLERCHQQGFTSAQYDGYVINYPTFLWDLSLSLKAESQIKLTDHYLLTWKRMTLFRFFSFHVVALIMIVLSFQIAHFRAIIKAVLRYIAHL